MSHFKRSVAYAVSLLFTLAGVGLVAGPARASTTYYYAAGQQTFAGTLPTGITANVTSYNPLLDTTAPNTEGHTLVELAVAQGGGATQQIVEVMLRKAPGDAGMKLMATAWRNSAFCGYATTNLCGSGVNLVQCNGAPSNCTGNPDVWDFNDVVAAGTVMKLGLTYSASTPVGGAWWIIAYVNGAASEYLGYIPSGLWSGAGVTFVSADAIHAYGETAPGSGALGCTDMGDGTLATGAVGGLIGSVTAVGLPTSAVDIDAGTVITDATKYNFAAVVPGPNVRTVRYGGPGAC